ncbi:MAG: cytochrome C [Alphaproteobacteria bacterium]
MSLRRTSATLCLASLAAMAMAACATTSTPEPAAPAAAVATPKPAAPSAAAMPAAVVERPPAFAICGACHGTTADAPPGLGPNLHGVVGRKAGSLPDYDYSDAMKASGKVWTVESLQAFVTDPGKAIPGNKMDYDGADAASAKLIAEYMVSLK